MPEKLPKLTGTQMDRLVGIGVLGLNRPDEKPATSAALVELGLIEIYDRRPNPHVTVQSLRLTPAGIAILAGFPGDEFDRFRLALAQETSHAD